MNTSEKTHDENPDYHKILTYCPLCEEQSLHVINTVEGSMLQCLYCGYASGDKFFGETAEDELQRVDESVRKFAKQHEDRTWIPGILTLPTGMVCMVEDQVGNPAWAFAPMVTIPEEEQESYPDPNGGYYQQRYDTDNQILFEHFYDCLEALNKVKFIKKNATSVQP